MDLPLSQAVGYTSASSRESLLQLAQVIAPSNRIIIEITDGELLLHAVSELDLEIAVDRLKATSPTLRVGKPTINYMKGKVWQEPFATLVVQVPAETVEVVCRDLRSRRAEIHGRSETEPGQAVVQAIAPMAELFGYLTSLRSFTHGRGSFEQEFLGYRPFPRSGAGDA